MNSKRLMLSMSNPKKLIFEQFAELARVLGNAHRLALLEQVSQGERSVERLAQITGLAVANTSQHLQHLRRGGYVQSRRDGKRVIYRLGDGPVGELLKALRLYAEHSRAEVHKIVSDYFFRLDALEPVSRADLIALIEAGTVTVLDVRPGDEFALGHLPGALNIPFDEIDARLGELSKAQEIVAYCRGPYCILSFEVVADLRAKGYLVRRLEDGLPEWKALGLPVEVVT